MKHLLNIFPERENVISIEEMDLYPEFMVRSDPPFKPWEDRLYLKGLRVSTLLDEREKRRKSMPRRYKNAEKRIQEQLAPINRRFAIWTTSFGIMLLLLLEILWLYIKV